MPACSQCMPSSLKSCGIAKTANIKSMEINQLYDNYTLTMNLKHLKNEHFYVKLGAFTV